MTDAEKLKAVREHLTAALELLPAPPAPVVTPPVPNVPPTALAIKTPDELDRAISLASAGDVLLLADNFVYTKPLTLSKSITLTVDHFQWVPRRISLDQPLPRFINGISIPGDKASLFGIDVRHQNPLTDILTFTGKEVTLDSVRVLGDPTKGAKRGIAANGNGNCRIVHCYVEDCFASYPGSDSQAIIAWDMAPGLVIEDCYLSAGSETIMIGGADPSSEARIPADVTIRKNTITKRPEWQGKAIGVKNTLEMKNVKRALVEDNDISQSWGGHGQVGYLIVLTPRNQGGKAPYTTVEDVTIVNNRCSSGAAALNILGTDDQNPSQRLQRVKVVKNSFTRLDPVLFAGSNKMILIGAGPKDLTLDENVFSGKNIGSQVYFYGTPMCENLVVTNNTWPISKYGVFGDGATSGAAWAKYVSSGTFADNRVPS